MFEGGFGKVDLRTVTPSLWKSDKPASNTRVSWKLLIVLDRNKSMQEGLFGFLKHLGSFPKLLSFHILQNVSSFISFTCALKSTAIKILSYVLE